MARRRVDPASKALRRTTQRHSTGAGVDVPTADVERPDSLQGRPADIWDSYAPGLIARGMLTAADVMMFTIWCQLAEKVEVGSLTSGQINHFRMISADFGLSPAGKGRESIIKPTPKNKFFGD